MSQRLRPADQALLALDSAQTPMQNVTLEIFDVGDSGLDYDRLCAHIEDRIAFVPRYRQRLRRVPGGLAAPVWVDDEDFDLAFHVRRSAVPRPGTMDQLRELTERIASRRLDPDRPLWEVYFVEGLEHGRVAVLAKSHQVLVDGVATVDLGQVLLDIDAGPRPFLPEDWAPRPEPSPAALVLGALRDTGRRPALAVRTTTGAVGRTVGVAGKRAGQIANALTNRRVTPLSPLNVDPSAQRRVLWISTRLKEYRKVRRAHGGTVNDVILAAITGGLRTWLMTRAEDVGPGHKIRALAPMSVIDEDLEPTSLGSQVVARLVSLPVSEPSAVVRLHQVSYALRAHRETSKVVAADRIAGVSGFAPTTFHALGSRLAATDEQNANLVITNVPGPQFPMFLAGAQMVQTYPVPPLRPGNGLAIGVTSYDGGVYYGITADRDRFPDIDVLGQCIVEALDELVDSTAPTRIRARRGAGGPEEQDGV